MRNCIIDPEDDYSSTTTQLYFVLCDYFLKEEAHFDFQSAVADIHIPIASSKNGLSGTSHLNKHTVCRNSTTFCSELNGKDAGESYMSLQSIMFELWACEFGKIADLPKI